MTALHNGNTQRKSSVYNQAGENYFQQLSTYNRMNNHLRRILTAQSIVDSRNKKYTREKRMSAGLSNCFKPLDQILTRRDIIDRIAYDTVHNPTDLLRMKLGCDPDCGNKSQKRILEERHRSSHVQSRDGSPTVVRRSELNSATIRHSKTSKSNPPTKSEICSHESPRSSILTGKIIPRETKVDGTRRKSSNEAGHRKCREGRHDRVVESIINGTYSYDSSFEYLSDNSSVGSSEDQKYQCPSSSQPYCDANTERDGIESNRQFDKLSEIVQYNEEAKYAKFLYDITQEIMSKGLYTDHEFVEVFDKHIEANSQTLDKDKMLLETDQLKASLNMTEFSGNDNDIERHRTFSQTESANTLNERKSIERLRDWEKMRHHFDDSSKRQSLRTPAKNAILLLDKSPEMAITEHEVLVTLMDMKFDPGQARTICRSLRNTQTPSLPHMDETNLHNRITPQIVETEDVQNMKDCACRFRKKKRSSSVSATEGCVRNLPMKIGESQTSNDKPEVGIQTAHIVSQQSRGIVTSVSLEPMAEVTTVGTSSRSSAYDSIPDTIWTTMKNHRTRTTGSELQSMKESRDRSRMQSSNTAKESSIKNGRIDANFGLPISRPTKGFNEIDGNHKTYDKKNAKRAVDHDETVLDDRNGDDRKVTSKSKTSQVNNSTTSQVNFDDGAPTTDIVTECDSPPSALQEQDKRDKITDDELASLPEDYSRMEESASMLDSEPAEEFRVSSKSSQPPNLQSIVAGAANDKNYSLLDDASERKKKQIVQELDEITLGDSNIGYNAEDLPIDTPVERSQKDFNYKQIKDNQDDRRKPCDDTDESSASKRSPPRENFGSGDGRRDFENPPGPGGLPRKKRSTIVNHIAAKRNKPNQRSRSKPSEVYGSRICEKNSHEKRKKDELMSSPCLDKLVGRSDTGSTTPVPANLRIQTLSLEEQVGGEKKPFGVMFEAREKECSKLKNWSDDDTSNSSVEMEVSLQVTIEQGCSRCHRLILRSRPLP